MDTLELEDEQTEKPERDNKNPLNIEELTWSEFKHAFKWNQGEHVTLIGHTGSGKTELLLRLLPRRSNIVVFGTKGRDETMDQLLTNPPGSVTKREREGYKRIKSWASMPQTDIGYVHKRVILWPDITGIEAEDRQRLKAVFLNAMSSIYRAGGWCLAVDEISFMSDMLRLDGELKFMLQQGRSSGMSLIGGTQRPAYIPLAFYQSATHLFLWRENDTTNLKRLAEISGHVNKRAIIRAVQELKGPSEDDPTRETLYVNTRTGQVIKTIVEL